MLYNRRGDDPKLHERKDAKIINSKRSPLLSLTTVNADANTCSEGYLYVEKLIRIEFKIALFSKRGFHVNNKV